MLGAPEDLWLLASDAGYGFMAKLGDLYAKNRNGKLVLSVPAGARVLPPAPVSDPAQDRVVAVSSTGRMLVTSIRELPMLARGKGMKIIQVPPAKLKAREEYVAAMAAVPTGGSVVLHSGKRTLGLKPADLEHYAGERGRRGSMLPRGFRQVARIVPVLPEERGTGA
jgi:topoisomerase-4 subunit A